MFLTITLLVLSCIALICIGIIIALERRLGGSRLPPPGSFADWYRDSYPSVLRYLACVSLDGNAAIDLTAESFTQAFEVRDRIWQRRTDERLGWLWVLVKENLSRHQPGTAVELSAIDRLGFRWGPVSEEERRKVVELGRSTIEHNELYDAFAALTPLHWSIVRMRVVFGLSEGMIAEYFGYDRETVLVAVSESLRRLTDHGSLRAI